jgi:hypothetical protein
VEVDLHTALEPTATIGQVRIPVMYTADDGG